MNSGWVMIPLLIGGWFLMMLILQYSSDGNLIAEEILNALKYLFVANVIYFIYEESQKNARTLGLRPVLWKGFMWCAGIAIIFAVNLGSPTCIDSEQDNRGTTCLEYADDGYEPSPQAKYAEFAFFFILFYAPVIAGARKGNQEKML